MSKPPPALLPFEEIEEGALDQRRIFAVRQDRVRSQRTGKEMQVDRLVVPDWVNVVAFAGEGDSRSLLLVRQWRFGARQFCLELPAGMVDPGEQARPAALRELLEETGHAPASDDDVVCLGETLPNAAFMNNRVTSFLVQNTVKIAEPKLDATEELELSTLPIAQIDDAVRSGQLVNSLGLVALYRWRLHQQSLR